MIRFKWSILGLSGFAATGISLATWHQIDRPAMLQAACDVGFPNFSRPAEIDADEVGCAILSPKQIFSGVLVTGFEASNFSSPSFPAVPSEFGTDDDRAWFRCPKSGCGRALNEQLDRDYFQECFKDDLLHTGFARVRAEGWVTVSEGRFGHLNAYPRDFFADRILEVAPPPSNLVREWQESYRQHSMCTETR